MSNWKHKVIEWTIQGQKGSAVMAIETFLTKREAVAAMESQRSPKSTVQRFGRKYLFTTK